jgi:hypothetical protein
MTPIIVPEQFIRATRDSGYRSPVFALAELVDNAIDAGASAVDVVVWETKSAGDRQITIAVQDNGKGMDRTALTAALKFGGSERFGRRDCLGRYGMGLPTSSVSQAPRVDVYTWRDRGPPMHTFLDVDQIAGKRRSGIPKPRHRALPPGLPAPADSGVLVVWSRCDRLRFKKASTIAEKLKAPLGRMYRDHLNRKLVIRVNDDNVSPVDPLFRVPSEDLAGGCEPYGDPLRYVIRTPSGGDSLVTVQFVELPVTEWHGLPGETKRRLGIAGGAGISILRSGREIDYGWQLFGAKRRENYDDWWRCELRFGPDLDELFGITNSKQGINPTRELRAVLEPDLERIARELNRRVRTSFQRARPATGSTATKRAGRRDRLLPAVVQGTNGLRRRGTTGYGYDIILEAGSGREFFTTEMRNSRVTVIVNQNHPFYEKLTGSPRERESTEILMLAAARALLDLPDESRRTFVTRWSDNLTAFLER